MCYLTYRGFDRTVIAPWSIPRKGDASVNPARLEATVLVQFYANGLLTIVYTLDAQAKYDRKVLFQAGLRSIQRLNLTMLNVRSRSSVQVTVDKLSELQ